jgi:hypothetical protein
MIANGRCHSWPEEVIKPSTIRAITQRIPPTREGSGYEDGRFRQQMFTSVTPSVQARVERKDNGLLPSDYDC